MKKPTTSTGALAALLLAMLALPAAATAEEAIPPGNSAVNQYTESLPTPTGHTNTEKSGKQRHRSPDKTLGSRNADRLEAHGPDGRAAAEAAAETAPPSVPPPPDSEEEAASTQPAGSGSGGGGDGKSSNGGGSPAKQKAEPSGGKADRAPAEEAVLVNAQVDEPSGSSGLGEALGEATGASSTGWLLPLLILATAIWALAYAMRQRRRVS